MIAFGDRPTVWHPWVCLWFCASLSCARSPLEGQETWILGGVVVEAGSGRPVPAADVELPALNLRRSTGDDGRFVFRGVPEGAYRLRVVALGYEEYGATTIVRGGSSDPVRVELRRAPIPLKEIVIAPGAFGILEASPGVSGFTVSREDIEAIPQAGDDAFRTLKRMPGVATGDLSAKLNVRGGTAENLLVRLDGLELDEPYHLKDFDGVFGIVDVQSLGSIELVTGGFPAEFGDRWGGVFDMRSRRPPPEGARTTVGASLSSLSLNSQGSFAAGHGQFLAALRRGYLDVVLGLAGVEDELSPAYWDALGRVRYLLSDEHMVSAEVLHAGDDVVAGEEGSEERVVSTWADTYAWITWEAAIAPRLRAETVLSVGRHTRNRSGVGGAPYDGVFKPTGFHVSDVSTFRFGGVRQDWQLDLTDELMLKAGVDWTFSEGEYDYLSVAGWREVAPQGRIIAYADTNSVELEPKGHELGTYVAVRGRAPGRVAWESGLRFDHQTHTGDEDLAPRFMLRWDVGDGTSVRGSWGRYFQSHGITRLAVGDGETAFGASERAEQVALGVERRLGDGLSARLEAYQRTVDDPRAIYVNLAREPNPLMEVMGDRERLDPTRGKAKGVEVLVSREGMGSLTWSAGYTLARTELEVDEVWIPRTYDQTHTVNLFAIYRRGRKWQFSGSWHYHTGWPVTEQFLERYREPEDGGDGGAIILRTYGALQADRLPAYHRLDLRATRVFEFERSRLELFIDIFNVYDRSNLNGYDYYLPPPGEGPSITLRKSGDELFPRLPTVGLRWVF